MTKTFSRNCLCYNWRAASNSSQNKTEQEITKQKIMIRIQNRFAEGWFLFFCLTFSSFLHAQQETPSPVAFDLLVVDAANDEPLPKVTSEINNNGKLQTLHTDIDGHVAVPPADSAGGYFGLFAELEGYVKRVLEWRKPQESSASKTYTLKLEEATSIRGKVTDDTGTPISDATIVVTIPNAEQPARNGIDRNYVSYEAIKSDSEGNWVFKGAPKEFESVQLGVWSYRHVSGEFFQFQTFQSKEARDGSITLTLPRGVSIDGTVLDKDDKPLKGARVMYGGQMASNKMDPQLTDDKGKFFYTAQEGEKVTLTVTASGHAPELATFQMDDQTHELTVYMAESQPMFGRIVGPNDEPIPFAWVFPDTWRGSRSLETRIQADKEGKFMWKDAPYDEVKCDIDGTSEGYVREERKLIASEKEIVISLRKALRVSGTVVDQETGKAIEQFQVIRGVMWDAKKVQWERNLSQKPSTGGKFSYTEGWARPGFGIRIEAPGYLPEERSGFKLEEEQITFDFELMPAANVTWIVTDQAGSPVPKAKAYLTMEGQSLTIRNGIVQNGTSIEATSNAEGIVEFPPQDRKYSIVILCDAGYAEIDNNRIEDSNKVQLLGWGKLSGTLLLNDKPAANEKISIRSKFQGMPMVRRSIELTTDAAGKFSFDRIPEGEIAVSRRTDIPLGNGAFRLNHTLTVKVEIIAGETATVTLVGDATK